MRRLAPIERRLYDGATKRPSEQTQTAVLYDEGRFLLYGGRESTLHLVDAQTGGTITELPLNSGRIRVIQPLLDEGAVAVGTDHGVKLIRVSKEGKQTALSIQAAAFASAGHFRRRSTT